MQKDQLDLIRRIASVVAHELRNPLAVINNSAYFLKSKLSSSGDLDPKVAKHLDIVSSEIGRLDGMIADILSYSKPLTLKTAPGALNDCVTAALAGLPLPEGVKVSKKLAAPSPKAALDAEALGEALRRVIENAAEAMPGGGLITVASGAAKGEAWIEVSDEGPGFTPEALGRVFEPFCTTKPKGLGLGLAMARKAVAAMGGSMLARNAAAGGAVVRCGFPSA